jgi:hypothetical protein
MPLYCRGKSPRYQLSRRLCWSQRGLDAVEKRKIPLFFPGCPACRPSLYQLRKCNETVHRLYTDFKEACDSVRREELYNIFVELGEPMKLVRLIKMY